VREITFTVGDPLGLHARPAGNFVKLAQEFESEGTITLERSAKSASVKRLLAVMSLGVKGGDRISILLKGEDEEAAAHAIQTWLEENLG